MKLEPSCEVVEQSGLPPTTHERTRSPSWPGASLLAALSTSRREDPAENQRVFWTTRVVR